jgi:hypothetical protein
MNSQRLGVAKKAGQANVLNKDRGHPPIRKKTGELRSLKIKVVQKDKGALTLLNSWIEEDEKNSTKRNAEWKRLKKALDDERHSERKLFPGK